MHLFTKMIVFFFRKDRRVVSKIITLTLQSESLRMCLCVFMFVTSLQDTHDDKILDTWTSF